MLRKTTHKPKTGDLFIEIRRNQWIIQSLIFFCTMLGTAYFVLGISSVFQVK
ncbi:MAG: hypothetical protein ACOH5I_20250 [Oligoflexus sp.]